jgi:hypothetical protein
MYFGQRAFPEIVSIDYTLRGIDYVLGRPTSPTCQESEHARS